MVNKSGDSTSAEILQFIRCPFEKVELQHFIKVELQHFIKTCTTKASLESEKKCSQEMEDPALHQ